MGLGQFEDIASEFDCGNLHAEAETEVGNVIFASITGSLNFSFDAALAEATGNQESAESF